MAKVNYSITEVVDYCVYEGICIWTEEQCRENVEYSSEEEFQKFLDGEIELPSKFAEEYGTYYSVDCEE